MFASVKVFVCLFVSEEDNMIAICHTCPVKVQKRREIVVIPVVFG